MQASQILTLLQQVPPRYELVVMQGAATHRIQDLTFSHNPPQVTLRLVLPEPEATIAELNGEVPVDLIVEVAPLPHEEVAPVVAEIIAEAPAKRTRKPKAAPFGTA